MSARALVALAVGVVTFALYAPVMHFDFIRYDDPNYIVQHPLISQGLTWHNLGWALTAFEVGNWHPLTLISHMVDVSLFGMRPGAHHAVNALLHAGNAALLFLFFDEATRRRAPSVVVAALFAVHPLNVEAVAWLSQRKSVLCMLFLLLTILAYGAWTRRGGRARYAIALVCYAAALASKPIAVVLPALLLLIDFWPLRRKSFRLLDKAPFAALAAAASLTTWAAQRADGAMGSLQDYPPAGRLARAIFACAWYLVRMVWPTDLSLFYPTTLGSRATLRVAAAAVLLAVVTVAVVPFFRKRRYLVFGWAWYLIALVPVLGLVQFGTQIVADRYAYLALIGPFAAFAFLGDELAASRSAGTRRAVAVAAGTVLVALAFGTGYALVPWRDSVSILRRGVERAPDNVHALTNLGLALVERARFDEGISLLQRAAEAVPLHGTVHVNLGYAYAKAGRLAEARVEYETAVPLRPDDALLRMELGRVLTQLRRFDEAEARFLEAVQRDPQLANAWLFLGTVLHTQGRFVEAEPALERAATLLPGDARALTAWGVNLAALGRRDEAVATLRSAVRADPGFERARMELERIGGPGNSR